MLLSRPPALPVGDKIRAWRHVCLVDIFALCFQLLFSPTSNNYCMESSILATNLKRKVCPLIQSFP